MEGGENLNACMDGAEVFFLRKIASSLDLKENIHLECCAWTPGLFQGSYFVIDYNFIYLSKYHDRGNL